MNILRHILRQFIIISTLKQRKLEISKKEITEPSTSETQRQNACFFHDDCLAAHNWGQIRLWHQPTLHTPFLGMQTHQQFQHKICINFDSHPKWVSHLPASVFFFVGPPTPMPRFCQEIARPEKKMLVDINHRRIFGHTWGNLPGKRLSHTSKLEVSSTTANFLRLAAWQIHPNIASKRNVVFQASIFRRTSYSSSFSLSLST